MKVTKLGRERYTFIYTNLTLMVPWCDLDLWKVLYEIFYLKGIESKYDPQTTGGSNSTWGSFLAIEPESAFIFVLHSNVQDIPEDLWEHLRYFYEQSPPAPLSPPTNIRVHQLMDKFLALVFLTFHLCMQAPVETLPQVNPGRLKPCRSPRKPKEKWKYKSVLI